jgi:hypothetical protein
MLSRTGKRRIGVAATAQSTALVPSLGVQLRLPSGGMSARERVESVVQRKRLPV